MLAVPIAAPQIWLFYAFSFVFAALVVRMLVGRTKELGGRKDGKSRHGIILQSLGLAFAAIGPARAELSWLSAPAIVSYAAVLLLMGSACALFGWSSGQLGKNWSLQARTRDDHELVRSGPYARARHPI
jgi:protein-S-isoprenylcysteine O-methyltransferase Ste14